MAVSPHHAPAPSRWFDQARGVIPGGVGRPRRATFARVAARAFDEAVAGDAR